MGQSWMVLRFLRKPVAGFPRCSKWWVFLIFYGIRYMGYLYGSFFFFSLHPNVTSQVETFLTGETRGKSSLDFVTALGAIPRGASVPVSP